MTGPITLAGTPAMKVPEGANACMGTVTMNGTSAVSVATTAISGNTRVHLTCQPGGTGTPGVLRVASITAGTGFTVVSTSSSDQTVVAWWLVDHT
jgi:hypothetical protein